MVRALNRAKRVVVRDQSDDALELFGGTVGTGKKLPCERRTFKLLIFAVGSSIFFAAQGTGNIVDDCGKLQRLKCVLRQALACADGGGVSVDLQKVVDIVPVSVREKNHLLHGFRDGHTISSLRFCIRAFRRGQEPIDVVRGVCDGAARGVDGEVLEEHGGDVAALAEPLIEVVTVAVVGERLIAEV